MPPPLPHKPINPDLLILGAGRILGLRRSGWQHSASMHPQPFGSGWCEPVCESASRCGALHTKAPLIAGAPAHTWSQQSPWPAGNRGVQGNLPAVRKCQRLHMLEQAEAGTKQACCATEAGHCLRWQQHPRGMHQLGLEQSLAPSQFVVQAEL